MKRFSILAFSALLLSSTAFAGDDDFKHWTRKQLEVKVKRLLAENRELREKIAKGGAESGAGSQAEAPSQGAQAAPAGSSTERVKAPNKKVWVLDTFDADGLEATNGFSWYVGMDTNNMGTKIAGTKVSGKKGKALRLKGFMPTNEAPWPWALGELWFSEKAAPTDLTGYRAVEFWAKGDGGTHLVRMHRMAVKDHAFPMASFVAPKEWTKVSLPLSEFAQPSWAQPVEGGLNDVHQIVIAPGVENAPFDFAIDELVLVK